MLEVFQFGADRCVSFSQAHFAQLMQFRPAAALKTEIREIKQVEFSGEGGFGTARSFCDGGKTAEIACELMHDQAGLR